MSPNPVVTWPAKHSRWPPKTMYGDTLELSRAYLSGAPPEEPDVQQDEDLAREPERVPCLVRSADDSIELVNNDLRYAVYIADTADLQSHSMRTYGAVKRRSKISLQPSDPLRYTLRPGITYAIAVGPPPLRREADPHYVVLVWVPLDAVGEPRLDPVPTNYNSGLKPSMEETRIDALAVYLAGNEVYRRVMAYAAYQYILDLPNPVRVSNAVIEKELGVASESSVRRAINKKLFGAVEYDYLEPDGLTKLLVTEGLLTKRDVRLACAERRRRDPTLPRLIAD